MGFTRATAKPFYLRLALDGPAGSGKTWTGLEVATFFAKQYGDMPPAYIDTERGSASKYASKFTFDVVEMAPPFHPDRFVKGIQMAVNEGYKVLVIDSLSHAWNGPGGLLELVDNFAKRYGGNSYAGWKDATPIQTRLIDTIIGAELHIIGCMRAKMDYAQDKDDRGRTTITKVGLAPVQREGMEYEFDVIGDITVAHSLSVTKTRCTELTDQLFVKPGRDFARVLWNWTQSGITRDQLNALDDAEQAKRDRAYVSPVATVIAKVAAPIEESVVYEHGDAPAIAALEQKLAAPPDRPGTPNDAPPWMTAGETYSAQAPAPSPVAPMVKDGNGTTHVVIENRDQFADFLASDVLNNQTPPTDPVTAILNPQRQEPRSPARGQATLPGTADKPKTGNGNGAASMASEVTTIFPGMCAKMVADTPYYRNAQGGADMFRILRAVKAEGYPVVNLANVAEVISKITARGIAHQQEEEIKAAERQAKREIAGG